MVVNRYSWLLIGKKPLSLQRAPQMLGRGPDCPEDSQRSTGARNEPAFRLIFAIGTLCDALIQQTHPPGDVAQPQANLCKTDRAIAD